MNLEWGKRYLMCPPAHFGVLYEINPWMHREVPADPERTQAQWDGLVATLREAGAEVETLDPVEGLPDMVFTANAGIVDGEKFVVSRFLHPERAAEEPYYAKWFGERGFDLVEFPSGLRLEGAGDVLP
ncbi:MAG TPA: arginine deiminase-related protein, partial [Actinomycetota bacterium]|nr:arginine deiminase-related protein [Actinomycetota bacterium]